MLFWRGNERLQLRQLLINWKKQNAESLAEIHRAAAETKESYNDQIEAIKQSLKSVSRECVSDIKEVGMATTGAIAEANSETLERVQQAKQEAEILKEEIKSLRSSVQADRQKNSEAITAIADRFQQTTRELNQANTQLKNSIFEAKKFQQRVSWARRVEWFTPLFALFIVGIGGGVAGGWLTARFYNSPSEQLGRNLTKWNRQQILKCANQNQSQCLLHIRTITDN